MAVRWQLVLTVLTLCFVAVPRRASATTPSCAERWAQATRHNTCALVPGSDDNDLRRLARVLVAQGRTIALRRPVDKEGLVQLERTGLLRHITRLTVRCVSGCAKLLARSKQVRKLVRLSILQGENPQTPGDDYPFCGVSTDSIAALAKAKHLTALRHLKLGASGVALGRLLRAPWIRSLTTLDICTPEAGLKRVAASNRLVRLRSLTIRASSRRPSAATLRRLVRSKTLAVGLRRLHILGDDAEGVCVLSSEAAVSVAKNLRLPRLRVFDLSYGYCGGDSGIEALIAAPWAQQLVVLDLRRTRFDTATSAAIVARDTWPRLEVFCISDRVAGDDSEARAAVRAHLGDVWQSQCD